MFAALFLAAATAYALPAPPLEGPHAAQQRHYGKHRRVASPPPTGTPLPPPTTGPDRVVYGYQAYWDDDLYAVPWDDLSHIALFAAEASSTGTLSSTSRWDEVDTALALAAPYGVKVHLCVINFSTSELTTLLGSATYRDTLLDALEQWAIDTGVDGINVDFEGLPSSRKQQMVDFTAALASRVGEVVLATPAVDWSGAWDYSELTRYADLFIMGYGYHWSGSSESGPTDPLFSGAGTVWPSKYSLAWTLDDYLYFGGNPDRIILGLPLYGHKYPVAGNSVPTSNLGTGSSVFMATAKAAAATHGAQYESTSLSNYYYDGTNQVWYPEIDTVRERVQYAESMGVAGVGFWALHYDDDDPAFWQMIHDETTTPDATEPTDPTGTDPTDATEPTDPTDGTEPTDAGGAGAASEWVADPGRPFLAYVGDTVVLSGEGSRGPSDEMAFDWKQVAGPAVTLVSPSSATPSFAVQAVGTHVFELVVGDGDTWSAPARSHVVVIDPDAGKRHQAKGCDTSGGAILGWLGLFPLAALRRRRPSR